MEEEVDYFGFIYIWFDTKRKKFCIGSHQGTIDDGYITYTGHMPRAYKKRPETFRRKILEYCFKKDRKELHRLEERWLSMIKKEELGKRYYNLKRKAAGGNVTEGHSLERRRLWKEERSRPVIIDGVRYPSRVESSRILGFNTKYRLNSKALKYREYYFEDEGKLPIDVCQLHEQQKLEPSSLKNPTFYAIMIDGRYFPNCCSASRELGIQSQTIRNRVKNPKFSNYISVRS